MFLKVSDTYEQFATSGVAQGCIDAGISTSLSSIIVTIYKHIMSEFAAWGDHFIWESDDEDELKLAVAELHKSLIKCNKYRFDLLKAEFPDFANGSDVLTESGENSSMGMSEVAPINSVVGDITTPNAKSNADGTYSRNRTENYYRNKERAYEYSLENNMYSLIREIFEPIIYEHTWIY